MLTLLNHAKLSSSNKSLHQRRVHLTLLRHCFDAGWAQINLRFNLSLLTWLWGSYIIFTSTDAVQYILSNILTRNLFSTKQFCITSKSFNPERPPAFVVSVTYSFSLIICHKLLSIIHNSKIRFPFFSMCMCTYIKSQNARNTQQDCCRSQLTPSRFSI